MKNRLEFSLFALLALYLIFLCVWFVATGAGPLQGWNNLARDWGAIIGGLVALVAAAITVRAMNGQSAAAYALELRREARQVAADIRSFERFARDLHDRAWVAAEVALRIQLENNGEVTSDAKLEPLPNFDCGVLPDGIRQHISASLINVDRMCSTLRNGELTALVLSRNTVERFTKWHAIEAQWLIGLIFMEWYARRIEDKQCLVEVGSVLPDEEVREVARSLGLKPEFEYLAEELAFNFDPIPQAAGYIRVLRDGYENRLENYVAG